MVRRLVEVEKEVILNAIRECDGNLAQAATLLGIAKSTIYRKFNEWRSCKRQDSPTFTPAGVKVGAAHKSDLSHFGTI